VSDVANVLTISIVASFFNDPSPPDIAGAKKSYSNIWPYENVETYFYSSGTKRYLQVTSFIKTAYKVNFLKRV
jgi:hypothetical protein